MIPAFPVQCLLRAFVPLVAFVVIACNTTNASHSRSPSNRTQTHSATAASVTVASIGTGSPSAIQHVFVVVMENESASTVLRDANFRALASQGTLLTNYYGVAHPSQPNYIAMLAGVPLVTDDGRHNLPQRNLVDLLEDNHTSWKAYQEDYPGNCYSGTQSGNYARKHNPFISFDDIRNQPSRCALIVNATALNADIANNRLPAFAFYTPNLIHDGHDASLASAGKWLRQFLEPKLRDPNFARGTLVVVTFDEGSGSPSTTPLFTLLLGDSVRAGAMDGRTYTQYSLLRTVEEVFGLGNLGRGDASTKALVPCAMEVGCP